MGKITNKERIQRRDATAAAAEEAANSGHYLDRLENLARVLESRECVMAVGALRQLHEFCGSLPAGSNGMQYEISIRLLIKAEYEWKFTQEQMNKLWYGVHWDAHGMFKMTFPYGDAATDGMKSNTTQKRGA